MHYHPPAEAFVEIRAEIENSGFAGYAFSPGRFCSVSYRPKHAMNIFNLLKPESS